MDRALRAVAEALTRVESAQAQLDAALVAAADQHVPSTQLCELLGLTRATFWRRVRAARVAVGQ